MTAVSRETAAECDAGSRRPEANDQEGAKRLFAAGGPPPATDVAKPETNRAPGNGPNKCDPLAAQATALKRRRESSEQDLSDLEAALAVLRNAPRKGPAKAGRGALEYLLLVMVLLGVIGGVMMGLGDEVATRLAHVATEISSVR